MSICLAMLVKNEEKNVARAVCSVLGLIDKWCIVDTGSTDKTREVVDKCLGDVRGSWHERPWERFDINRTELLKLAAKEKTDYILMMDADEEFIEVGELPTLTLDAYDLRYTGNTDYAQPRIIKADLDWSFEGVAHSYLKCKRNITRKVLDSPKVMHHGNARHGKEKFKRDRKLLEKAHLENPADARTVFYLAQTYRDLGMANAAISFYRQRAEMGGWAEEAWFARYQLGCLLCKHTSFEKGAAELLAAYRQRPTRIEPLRALAASANAVADKAPYPKDVLFINRSLYRQPLPASKLQPVDSLPKLKLPADNGWSLPEDFYGYLAALIRKHRPKMIVECGSGPSTAFLAAMQREHSGRVVAVEHLPEFAQRTQRILDDNGLKADLRLCPLDQVESWQWYALQDIPEKIGMLLVDGPPAASGHLARYPALPILNKHLIKGAPIVLDDVSRPDEIETVRRWQDEYSLKAEIITHSKCEAALMYK